MSSEVIRDTERAGGRTIARFGDYADAQRAVDALSDRKFAVEHLAIVGGGLRLVEQVTGRMGYLKAGLSSGLSGAGVGALIGWLFGLFDWIDPLEAALFLALWGLVLGFVIGAVIGMLGHAATGGRRDFSSVLSMRADYYELLADEPIAQDAVQELSALDLLTPSRPGG